MCTNDFSRQQLYRQGRTVDVTPGQGLVLLLLTLLGRNERAGFLGLVATSSSKAQGQGRGLVMIPCSGELRSSRRARTSTPHAGRWPMFHRALPIGILLLVSSLVPPSVVRRRSVATCGRPKVACCRRRAMLHWGGRAPGEGQGSGFTDGPVPQVRRCGAYPGLHGATPPRRVPGGGQTGSEERHRPHRPH